MDIKKFIKGCKNRDEAVALYAGVILGQNFSDEGWSGFNHLILERWSVNGLQYIKNKAWELGDKRGDNV